MDYGNSRDQREGGGKAGEELAMSDMYFGYDMYVCD